MGSRRRVVAKVMLVEVQAADPPHVFLVRTNYHYCYCYHCAYKLFTGRLKWRRICLPCQRNKFQSTSGRNSSRVTVRPLARVRLSMRGHFSSGTCRLRQLKTVWFDSPSDLASSLKLPNTSAALCNESFFMAVITTQNNGTCQTFRVRSLCGTDVGVLV
jgi:hypothetical protein